MLMLSSKADKTFMLHCILELIGAVVLQLELAVRALMTSGNQDDLYLANTCMRAF